MIDDIMFSRRIWMPVRPRDLIPAPSSNIQVQQKDCTTPNLDVAEGNAISVKATITNQFFEATVT